MRLGILGTHIGGSVTLMLALTEAKSINAEAALSKPVCDWTVVDEYYYLLYTSPYYLRPLNQHQ